MSDPRFIDGGEILAELRERELDIDYRAMALIVTLICERVNKALEGFQQKPEAGSRFVVEYESE